MSDDLLASGPLDTTTVRGGFERAMREWDAPCAEALLTRYVAQPLSDSERAWASMHLANVFAISDRAAEAVAAHETFERWLPDGQPSNCKVL